MQGQSKRAIDTAACETLQEPSRCSSINGTELHGAGAAEECTGMQATHSKLSPVQPNSPELGVGA
jgi:hypothetical protein